MSPIALPIAELKPALTGLGKVIQRHSALPVLQHLKIERTQDGWVALSATDLDHFVTVRLEQPSAGEPLSLLVPYDELLKLTKNCPKTDTLLIRQDDSGPGTSAIIQYAIGTQIAEAKVDSLPVAEFPEIPRIKGDSIPLPDMLRTSIHEALQCASTDESRLILNGAYLDTSKPGAHYVVGTDGRHLYSSNSFSLPLKQSINIPTHKFIGWKEFNHDGEWQLRVGAAAKDAPPHLQLSSRRWRFITRQIEGNYPNWRQVVPTEFQTKLEFDPQSVVGVVAMIERLPCDDAVNFAVGLEWKAGRLALLGRSATTEPWTKVEIEGVQGTGPDVTIFANRHLVAKALQFGLTTVELSDRLSPLRFSHEGRQMIVMPTRTNPAPVATSPTTPEPVPAKSPEPIPPDASPASPPKTPPMPEATNEAPVPNPTPAATPPALETALAQIEVVRGDFRNALAGLQKLSEVLKQAQREQKAGEKDLQSVRQTIKTLQSVRI